MIGTKIVAASPREGVTKTVLIDGTPKPGTALSLKAAVAMSNGRFTYEALNVTYDGQPVPVAILEEDRSQGKTAADAAVTGELQRVYFPAVGEEINVLVKASSGAGTVGRLYMLERNTGKAIALPTQVADYSTFADLAAATAAVNLNRRGPVFRCLEAFSDPGSDRLSLMEFIG